MSLSPKLSVIIQNKCGPAKSLCVLSFHLALVKTVRMSNQKKILALVFGAFGRVAVCRLRPGRVWKTCLCGDQKAGLQANPAQTNSQDRRVHRESELSHDSCLSSVLILVQS